MIIQRFHTILIFKSKVRMKLRCCSESLSHKRHVDRQLVQRDEQSGQISPDYSNTYYHPSFSHIAKKNPLFSGVVNVSRSLWERLLEQRNFIRIPSEPDRIKSLNYHVLQHFSQSDWSTPPDSQVIITGCPVTITFFQNGAYRIAIMNDDMVKFGRFLDI